MKRIFLALCMFTISTQQSLAADYSHGDACSTAGAFHQSNDANNMDFLICDGANWVQSVQFPISGNNISLDNDPTAGDSGCLRYNGTTSQLEYSNDCTSYSTLGAGLWSNDGPDGPTEIYYSAGNVGINRANPTYPLDVNGSIRANAIRSSGDPTNTYIGTNSNITYLYVGGVVYAEFNGAAHITNIGTASATDPESIRIGFNDLLFIDNTNQMIGIKDNTPDAELDVVGDINYTGVIVDVSDKRMKKNIQPLQNALSKITSLQGVSFTMKDDPHDTIEYGLIAQDVERVFPHLVKEYDGIKSLNYTGMIGPIVEAIKEREIKNKKLKKQNAELKRKIHLLAKRIAILEGKERPN